jgi:hypothetical protein
MNLLCHRVANIAWALWFGGMIALLIFVQTLFRADRPLAVSAAPHLFAAFESCQLTLAAVAIAPAVPGLARARSIPSAWFPILLLIGAALAIVSSAIVTPEINRLRAANETHGPAFSRTHGISMVVYTAQAIVLLLAGMVMPLSPSHQSHRRAAEAAPVLV